MVLWERRADTAFSPLGSPGGEKAMSTEGSHKCPGFHRQDRHLGPQQPFAGPTELGPYHTNVLIPVVTFSCFTAILNNYAIGSHTSGLQVITQSLPTGLLFLIVLLTVAMANTR